MANVIQLRDGSTHTVFDLRDALRLVEDHMGDETRRLLEDCIAEIEDPEQYISDLEKENQRLRRAISDLTLDKLILQEAAKGNF